MEKSTGEAKQESEPIKLRKELETAKKLAEDRLNDLKYLHADFDNYRKRFEKEKEQIICLANESLIKELIIILDDFDASMALAGEENKEGIELMQKKFCQILEKHGLKQIEALGKKFNPCFHEVLCKELSEHNEDEILEEIQKGYMLHSKVIRPSRIKVAKKDLKEEARNKDLGKEEKNK